MSWNDTLGLCYSEGKFVRFEKIENSITNPPILFTEVVFKELNKIIPKPDIVLYGRWQPQTVTIKDYSGQIYGGSTGWALK